MPRRPRPSRLLAFIPLAALPFGLLAACSSQDDPREGVAELEVAWTSDVTGWDVGPLRVVGNGLWIYPDSGTGPLVAVSLEDGSTAWHGDTDDVCALSGINRAGLLAVQSGEACNEISVVDSATGEERWSSTVMDPANDPRSAGQGVQVTERSVAVASACSVERWSLADGKRLARLQGRGDDWECGTSVVVGDLAVVADRTGLVGYAVDAGDVRWRRPGAGASVDQLLSADPLLLDVSLDGIGGRRSVDPATGELGPLLGRPDYGRYGDKGLAVRVGDTVIGSYSLPTGRFQSSYDSALRAWDGATGEERWSRDVSSDDYLGSGPDGVLTGHAFSGPDEPGGVGYWVMRWSGDEARTVGWIDGHPFESVRVGDLLVTGELGSRSTVAYRLPETDSDAAVPEAGNGPSRPDWADGDLPEDPLAHPCGRVTPQTVRLLGLDAVADLPAPLDCVWKSGGRSLAVAVEVLKPDDNRTAVEAAEARVEELRAATDHVEVDDERLGDEVWLAGADAFGPATSFPRPGTASTDSELLVRRANVVIRAGVVDTTAGLPLPGAQVRAGLRSAVEETLTAWDLPDAGAPAGVDGPVTAVPEPCRVLAGDVRRVLTGATTEDLTEPGVVRLRGCHWWAEGEYTESHLQVTSYAVGPNAVTGADAVEEAKQLAERTGATALGEPLAGPWDEGWVGGSSSDSYVVVRTDNLVVVAQAYLIGDDADARRTTLRLARDYLAATDGAP